MTIFTIVNRVINNLSLFERKDLLCVQCECDKIDVFDTLYMVSAICNVKDKPFKRMRKWPFTVRM